MRFASYLVASVVALSVAYGHALPQTERRPNVILFVPDGLRSLVVTPETAPAMAALRARGVNFTNTHSIFPTVTMANATAMATGHYLGDTGVFSNTIFSAFAVPASAGSVTPFLENDAVLGDMDQHFAGDYASEQTIFAAARAAGVRTAAIGKLGPALTFDHTDRTGEPTIVIDDSTGTPAGIPLSDRVKQALTAAGLPVQAPARGENGQTGTSAAPGTRVANVTQQNYFVDAATKAILPLLKSDGVPFLMVVWSRDPDGSQHNQGDSLNALTPGINGPTSIAAIKNADDDLARIQTSIAALGLTDTTDVIVAADHGFSTISKESHTSPAAGAAYPDVPSGFLPPGFLAIDLAKALKLPLFDPDNKNAPVPPGTAPRRGNGLVGADPAHPQIVVAANGGSDLLYLPSTSRALAAQVVTILGEQDYVSAIFVNDDLGTPPGTLPLSAINLKGTARTPTPSIVVGFRTFSTGCPEPRLCAAEVADTPLQQGQGNHGSFSRADTMNFVAAAGPDFKTGVTDAVPVGNADIGQTIARLLKLTLPTNGTLVGRVLVEAIAGGATPAFSAATRRAPAAAGSVQTVLAYQTVGETRYFDAAGTIGRTIGLPAKTTPVAFTATTTRQAR